MLQKRFIFFLIGLLNAFFASAQGYQALHGSAYTGSTAVFNNPASSVNSAYKWDFSLLSLQLKMSTNSNFLDSAGLRFQQGVNSHFIHANIDLSLLNFLYKIDKNKAFNFNIRARTYNHIKTSPLNINDTINSIHSFLVTNRNTPFIDGFVTHAGWLEGDFNYSQVLLENNYSKITGGVTLQIMKGLSAAHLRINKLSFLESINAVDTAYNFTNGSGSFGYSNNYDAGGVSGISDLLKKSTSAIGLSLGVEYLLYNNETGVPNNTLNYNWKIGASIMDIGANYFTAGVSSFDLVQPKTTVPDNTVDNKLSGAADLKGLKDSLSTLFNSSAPVGGKFSVSLPTRMIFNVDKNLGNHFYVNADVSLNFFSSASIPKLHTRELNLITFTPRYETIGLGAYLPIQYNTQGQLWVGAAIKLGPLVLGVHNLDIFKKDPSVNGGGYLLLSLHPFNKSKVLSDMDCTK